MAIAIDPVISNIIFTLGLIPHIYKKTNGYYTPRMSLQSNPPVVSILIPLYYEPCLIIKNLSSHLLRQTYPHQKMEIIYITEPDDMETNLFVREIMGDMKNQFAAVKHLITDGKKKMKPYALNWAIKQCSGEIIGIYDAECEPEAEQIEKAVRAMFEQKYDLVQAKVEVVPENLLGELCCLDIYMWYEVFLPFINEKAQAFPLGTKCLFIKKDCLEEINGFPLHLTEDAMMSILLASRGKKFGLVESIAREKSVKTLGTHFKQRRRWFRGYLSCLWEMLRANISLKRKFWLTVPYVSPILCSLTLIGFFFMFLYFISWYFTQFFPTVYQAPWMTTVLYDRGLFYWSLFLGYIGIPLSILSYFFAIGDKPMEKKVFYAHLIPLYWISIGIPALASFFKTNDSWDKTKREL